MKRKMLTVLCVIFIFNLPGTVLASTDLEVETKALTNSNDLNVSTFSDMKQRSYYFYDMIPDYFEVQDFMREIYGDEVVDNSYQYYFLKLAKENFDKYYRTNNINDLDLAITYLYDHHGSVGIYTSYDVNYKITSNDKRAYVPSTFGKDKKDIGDFMMDIMSIR